MIDLDQLARFLVRAKVQTYAGDGKEVPTQRPGFKELSFSDGDWNYRDSYAGFFFAPGQEVVRFQEKPVWAMAYSGGMLPEHHGNLAFAKQTFVFLKEALKCVEMARPFRGLNNFKQYEWEYVDVSVGTVADFTGVERIFYRGTEVFKQNYMGGLIIPK